MHLLTKSLRRPVSNIVHSCVSHKNTFSHRKILGLPKLNWNITFYNTKYLMSSITCVNKNPIAPSTSLLQPKHIELSTVPEQNLSSSSETEPKTEVKKLSNKDKLKRAVKDYGATVIVFHVTISLMSLGISYLVISSGVDVASLLEKVGMSTQSNLAAGASTFVVAYAVHKVFAPVRISITLGATPFIVRYLRRVGVLKPPKT